MLSSIELRDRSEKIQWCDFVSLLFIIYCVQLLKMIQHGKDDQSNTDIELQSEYESATEEDDSEQYLEFNEYRLHTDSPAWAALFPLPDSPELVTMMLHATKSDVSRSSHTHVAVIIGMWTMS
jgi:hypothetical protein